MTQQVPVWHRFEWRLKAEREFDSPLDELSLTAEVHGPGRARRSVPGFWDGNREWVIRFRPDQPGEWRLFSHSQPADRGLQNQSTAFLCTQPVESQAPFRHGPVRVSRGERHLRHADGTPFFWLADTAWNGPLKAQLSAWRTYLEDRAAKRFNTIQFVMTQWMAAAGNGDARLAYLGRDPLRIDPEFFRWLDARFDLLNDLGFVAAPVLFWTAIWSKPGLALNPGTALGDDDLLRLGRYLLARYNAHHAVWILAGDGHYEGAEAERWRKLGRALFAGLNTTATIHPGGHLWVEEEFRNEAWYSFHGYQSGHWRDMQAFEWIVNGPAARHWRNTPALPEINLEPCYEGHRAFEQDHILDDFDVRQHVWLSLLATPPAGITYGCQGVWSWETEPRLPMSHPKTGIAKPWFEAMRFPGSTSMRHLRDIVDSLEWWRLLPAPELLEKGVVDAAAVATADRDVVLLYHSDRRQLRIRPEAIVALGRQDIDPATGKSPDGNTRDLVTILRSAS